MNKRMNKTLRKENFSQEEKILVTAFVMENRHIIEDKSNDMKMYAARQEKWKEIAARLTAMGTQREWKEVRGAYQRWKTAAKKSISLYKKQQQATGGSPLAPPPSATDYKIFDICPHDFEDDENPHDSDSSCKAEASEVHSSSSKRYELDPVSGELILIDKSLCKPTRTLEGYAVAATGSSDGGSVHSTTKRCVVAPLSSEAVAEKVKLSVYEEHLYELQVQTQERVRKQKEAEHKLKMEILRRRLEGEADERERKKRIDELQIKILERDLARDKN